MTDKGNCQKHGEFNLEEGCPQCMSERQQTEIIIVCDGGCGKTTEGMTFDTKEGEFEQIDESGVPKWTGPDCLTKKSQQPELESAPELIGEQLAKEAGISEPAAETAIVLRPGEDIEARGWFKEAERLLEYAEGRVITTAEDNKQASDDLIIIGNLRIVMENKRVELVKPKQDEVKAIQETYKALMEPILEAYQITREKMKVFDLEQQRQAQAVEELNKQALEVARKQAEMNKGEFTVDLTPIDVQTAPRLTRTELGVSGLVANWKYRIVNLALLPREYMMPDDVMLKATAKQHHDKKSVPGVEFYNDPYIAKRAR